MHKLELLTVKNFDRGHGSKYSIHWSRHPLDTFSRTEHAEASIQLHTNVARICTRLLLDVKLLGHTST